MRTSGVNRKDFIAYALVMTLAASAFLAISFDAPEPQAKESTIRDSQGYYYMDSNNPDPKAVYNWVDTTSTGTNLFISGYSSYAYVSLPFDFYYYSNTYSDLYVYSQGYVCFNFPYFSTSYSLGMPQSSSPNPMIAALWGVGYGNAYYLLSPSGVSPAWIAIEWSSNYGHNFELILYESGLIKMQYRSFGTNYPNGQYHVVGIEDETGTIGLMYSSYSEVNLNPQMAIEFSYAKLGVTDFEILNVNKTNPIAYAEYEFYTIQFNVYDEAGASDIYQTRIYFGPVSLGIYCQHTIAGGLDWWTLGGGSSSLIFDITQSEILTDQLNSTAYHMAVVIMFNFTTPLDGKIDITVFSFGKVALGKSFVFDDALYVDSSVKVVGETMVYSSLGRKLENEGYTMENENVSFTGGMLVYNSSDPEDPVNYTFPLNYTFYFCVIDDELKEFKDVNVSGRTFNISCKMPDRALRKEYRLKVLGGIPLGKVKSVLPIFAFRVDDSKPPAPQSLIIRADSFKDMERTMDNDDTLFVSWSSVKDSGSGVIGYRISSFFDPTNKSIQMVDPRTTQFVWQGTTEGIFTVYVWAEDGVGHVGDAASQPILIDKTNPIFLDFYPSQAEVPWLKTTIPDIQIRAQDGEIEGDGTSGIRKSTIEYSLTTKGIENFEDWVSADLIDEEGKKQFYVDVKVSPRLVEGTNNYIKFRAKDKAGNGYTESEPYKLDCDITSVDFQDFFPTPNVWHDWKVITKRDVSIYLVDIVSGVKTPEIYYRISNEVDKNGTYKWKTGIQAQAGWEQVSSKNWERMDGNKKIWVHFPYKDFQEGDQNFIQFMTKDIAGNGAYNEYPKGPWTVSPMYQILVNTQPVAVISSPRNGQVFYLSDLIILDGSDSYDLDVDKGNLKFEWKEGNRTIGYEMVQENVRFETMGQHWITLYVGDSVHKLDLSTNNDSRAKKTIWIEITEIIYTWESDVDGDKMADFWEWKNLLEIYQKDADEDADRDGYTNYQEYLGDDKVPPNAGMKDGNDPWDPTDKPTVSNIDDKDKIIQAPFELWVFMVVLVAAILIGAAIVLIGYLRIHRKEEVEKREEAEEEAMLATPQLEIPSMPMPIPMVDTSLPTLPAPAGDVEPSKALPPAPEEMVAQQPPQIEPTPVAPQEAPVQENPVYQAPAPEPQNPVYGQ